MPVPTGACPARPGGPAVARSDSGCSLGNAIRAARRRERRGVSMVDPGQVHRHDSHVLRRCDSRPSHRPMSDVLDLRVSCARPRSEGKPAGLGRGGSEQATRRTIISSRLAGGFPISPGHYPQRARPGGASPWNFESHILTGGDDPVLSASRATTGTRKGHVQYPVVLKTRGALQPRH